MAMLTEMSPETRTKPPATGAGSKQSAAEPVASGVHLDQPFPRRPAWVEIDLRKLKQNFVLINQDKPEQVKIMAVVKDDGYGHGAEVVARAALDAGAGFLALSTLEEAMRLRDSGFRCRLLLLGDRQVEELSWCV